MRVVLLQSVMALGGVEQHMLTLGRALRKLGHEAYVVGLIDAGGFAQLNEWSNADGLVPAHIWGGWPENPARTRMLLEQLEPDVVNVQLPMPPLLADWRVAPVVGTAHGEFSLEPASGLVGLVCLDHRFAEDTRRLCGRSPVLVRNGVDLERFGFRPDFDAREGVAYWGRFDSSKMTAARAVAASTRVDCWGDTARLGEENLVCRGRARPEDVLYRYRVVTATGLCALEAMACGALLLTPEPSEENLARWSDSNFAMEEQYPDPAQARLDLAGLLTMPEDDAEARASWCRQWVEMNHDDMRMAEQFLEVYEEAMR